MSTRRFLLVEIDPDSEYGGSSLAIEFDSGYRILADTSDAWEWNADDPFEREVYRSSGQYIVVPVALEEE